MGGESLYPGHRANRMRLQHRSQDRRPGRLEPADRADASLARRVASWWTARRCSNNHVPGPGTVAPPARRAGRRAWSRSDYSHMRSQPTDDHHSSDRSSRQPSRQTPSLDRISPSHQPLLAPPTQRPSPSPVNLHSECETVISLRLPPGSAFGSRSRQGMELGGERARPAAVSPRMDLQRDAPAALVQLQGAWPAGDVEVPVATSLAASRGTLASDHEAAPFALLENLLGAEVDAQLPHRATVHPPAQQGQVLRNAEKGCEVVRLRSRSASGSRRRSA
jgi:hypothetical protein